MARISADIGDVFFVVDGDKKRYFQLIGIDNLQLGSDVIRGFKRKYDSSEKVSLNEIIADEVDFYLHTDVRDGVKFKLWNKVGTISELGDFDNICFRDTNDVVKIPGKDPVVKSHEWYIWRLGDDEFTDIGQLNEQSKSYEIGMVFNPYDILDRMIKGYIDLSYYPT